MLQALSPKPSPAGGYCAPTGASRAGGGGGWLVGTLPTGSTADTAAVSASLRSGRTCSTHSTAWRQQDR